MSTPTHAWHYTTAAALIQIVTRHRLWATSAAYLNDSAEIRAGRLALREAVDSRESALESWQLEQLRTLGVLRSGDPHDLFLLCASKRGNSLTLWRSYGVGSEAEYSIDLDPAVSLLPIQQRDDPHHPAPEPPGWGSDALEYDDEGVEFWSYDPDEAYAYVSDWAAVEYLRPTSTAARKELDEVLKKLRKPPEGKRVMPLLLDYLAGPDPTAAFKHPGFADEREVRSSWTVQPWWRFVLYRASRFGVTPYIEVGRPSDAACARPNTRHNIIHPHDLDRLPIRTIRIGPTRKAAEAERSLRALLDANGYGHVEIKRSSTPYR